MSSGIRNKTSALMLRRALLMCALLIVSGQANAVRTVTSSTATNNKLETQLKALTGTSLGATFASLATPPLFPFVSLAFETVGIGADIAAHHTPSSFSAPANRSISPNAEPANSGDGMCRLNLDIDSNTSQETSSFFYIRVNPLDAGTWGDLGMPSVYHPHATVRVQADNASIYSPGDYQIHWEADTLENDIIDIAVPSGLALLSLGAKLKIAKNAKAKEISKLAQSGEKAGVSTAKQIKIAQEVALKKARYYLLPAKFGVKLGLVGTRQVNTDFLSKFTHTRARSQDAQSLTVWDTHPPYFTDTASGGYIDQQDITLEATDFGGVRLGRVKAKLRGKFNQVDDCNSLLALDEPDDSMLLKVDETTDVPWVTFDAGPYKSTQSLSGNQQLINRKIYTTLTQHVTVVDTQAPLLLPPAGFARESSIPIDLTTTDFPLGRPKIIDLADPRPTFSYTAPDVLEPNHRYAVVWQARDASGNVTVAPPDDPDQYTQFITIKEPGTNTQPVADDTAAASITSRAVEISLTANDNDFIDGRYDPLDFKIRDYPENGQFEAPLYPFFIEDFRLSPVGDHETIKRNEIVRTSPLKYLADGFRLSSNRPAFLDNNICSTPDAESLAVFNRTIPLDFVYKPTYVHVDDDGNYYVRDNYFVCNNSGEIYLRGPLPRISKWSSTGEFIDMVDIRDQLVTDGLVSYTAVAPDRFSMVNGLIWFALEEKVGSTINKVHLFGTNDQFSIQDPNDPTNTLKVLDAGEITDTASGQTVTITPSEVFQDITVDEGREVFYELRGFGYRVEPTSIPISLLRQIGSASGPLTPNGGGGTYYFLDTSDYRMICGSPSTCDMVTDIEVDSRGYVYIAQPGEQRILKYAPAYQDANDVWQEGALVGWMGSCTTNKLDSFNGNVPFNACDEAAGVSRGFQCTDSKCNRAADPSGDQPGQFNNPVSIVMSPDDVLYVSDSDNYRIQRFTTDGTFAGQATSTGTGINQGVDPDFILGNFGKPKYVSVNRSAFHVINADPNSGDYFLHIFRTLPFYDVTDNSAKVKYVSNYNFRGLDQFTYIVDDGITESLPATVSVDISRAYRPPEGLRAECYPDLASAQSLTNKLDACALNEDASVVVRMSSKDPDGFVSTGDGGLDSHTFIITEQPRHGRLSRLAATDNSAIYRYIPEADYNGGDELTFNAFDGVHSAKQDVTAELTVLPVPDPADIDMDGNFVAGRGFSRMINAKFSDVDQNYQPELESLDWGDGEIATATGNWQHSGRYSTIPDASGNPLLEMEISPQLDFNSPDNQPVVAGGGRAGSGDGMLVAAHVYNATGNYVLRVSMQNHDNGGAPITMFPTVRAASVKVIDATRLRADLELPPMVDPDSPLIVDPDSAFPFNIDITNQKPDGWDGLVANNTQVTLELPDGMSIVSMDSRCGGSTTLVCALGAVNVAETKMITLMAKIDLAAARLDSVFTVDITMHDDGPKIGGDDLSIATISIADEDGDAVIDAVDAFKYDARYAYDEDHDGMADEWERTHGLDPEDAADAASDPDSDFVTNLDEFENGTNPLLADAILKTEQLSLPGAGDDRLGFSVAAGDINGDGFTDVIAGAPNYNSGQGAVVIYYGAADGVTATDPVTVDATTGFGMRIAAGNVNGDEFSDIVVKSGENVYLYLGADNGLAPPVTIGSPDATASKFGNAMIIADIDDDNVADLLITAPDADSYGYTDNGAVYVYRGSSQYWLQASPQPGRTISFGANNAGMGDSLTISNLDGDTRPDLVVSAALATTERVIGFLGANIVWTSGSNPKSDFMFTPEIPTDNDRFGYSLASGQDIDGDGISDLVVGAYDNNGVGAAYVYLSKDQYWNPAVTPSPVKLEGEAIGGQFGVAVAMTPVIAYTDRVGLLVGSNRAMNDAGDLDAGEYGLYSLDDAFIPKKVISAHGRAHDMSGYSVASAGDINGDGVDDYVVGAPDISQGSYIGDGGYISVIYAGRARQQTDMDGDLVADSLDNCVNDANTDQADGDGDGIGDVCDPADNATGASSSSDSGGGGSGQLDLPVLLLAGLLIVLEAGRRRYSSVRVM